ncbi:MAG TPA: hypothetical protein VEU32_05460, partial [Burkholderiales bacterium]|nr:hypothetical protein [Burkholderiales bacterium]
MLADCQRLLDGHAALFEEIEERASLAIVARRTVAPACAPVPMILWVREPEGMAARNGEFSGYQALASDLLLVTNDGTLEAALASDEPLREVKRQLRAGGMMFMVLRRKDELRAHGWEDFLEWLGMPFLGTC